MRDADDASLRRPRMRPERAIEMLSGPMDVLDPSNTDGMVHNLVERVLAHSGPGMPMARGPET